MAHSYREAPNTLAERRTYQIVCGIPVDMHARAIARARAWAMDRRGRNLPVLTGTLSMALGLDGMTCLIFSGELDPQSHPQMTARKARTILNEMAAHLAEQLRQERVRVSYHKKSWELVREDVPADP